MGSQQSSLRKKNHLATHFRTKDESFKNILAGGVSQKVIPENREIGKIVHRVLGRESLAVI